MDAHSQLLSLGQVEVRLDLRCALNGNFIVPHDPLPPGQAVFHLVLAGECRVQPSDGACHDLVPGSFVLLPQGRAHSLVGTQEGRRRKSPRIKEARNAGGMLPVKYTPGAGGDGAVDLLCGRLLYTQGLGTLLMQQLPPVLQVGLHQTPGIEALRTLTQLLRDEVAGREPGAWAVINALAQALLAYALRAYGQRESPGMAWLGLIADGRLGATLQAMLDEPQQPWTLDSLAALAAMSRATYARRFKEKSGMTVGDVLLAVRMMHASKLMQQTRRTLADIAEAVGYQSEAAFGKAFRQALGSTPGQWRRQNAAQAV
jgi:AraC family transcriptional activator of mtrCDE